MNVTDFNFELPPELIAQDPLEDRSASRLLVLDKKTGEMEHRHFRDILHYLKKGDCLVINDTKVIPARLMGHKVGTDICGEYVVVADVGEKNFIVYNGDDSGKEITTDYPIVQAEVSKQGVVAVLLEESSSNVIRIYNPYDVQNKLLAEIPTNIDDGYPVSIDISDDGVNVAAVFVSVNDSKIQSRVAFYDFSDVGKNSNFLVGAQVYNDKLISEVKYLNDNDVCVFGEDGYCVWTNLRQPKVKFQKKYGTSIKSAFYNSKYIGVILDADDGNKNELEVFELSGKRKLKIELSEQYKQVQLNDNNEIMLNSDSKCVIYKMNGIKKFSSNIKGKVEHFYASGDNKCYYLVLENEIQKIKLKKIKKRG